MGTAQIHKILILGANPLVCDNVRVLLGSMQYQCLVASSLKEALELLEQERPDAAILDPQLADSPAARVVAMFHKRVPDLRGRTIVLMREESDPELLEVLAAYSFPRVQVDALFRELWPCLDSLFRRTIKPQQVFRSVPLVFDSFLDPSLAGVRSLQPACRQLLYESDTLVADLLLERQRDSQRINLTGHVLAAKGKPQLSGVPVVIQGQTRVMGIVKTNEWGEFRFEFESEPGISLEIRARENFWVSAGLPE